MPGGAAPVVCDDAEASPVPVLRRSTGDRREGRDRPGQIQDQGLGREQHDPRSRGCGHRESGLSEIDSAQKKKTLNVQFLIPFLLCVLCLFLLCVQLLGGFQLPSDLDLADLDVCTIIEEAVLWLREGIGIAKLQ